MNDPPRRKDRAENFVEEFFSAKLFFDISRDCTSSVTIQLLDGTAIIAAGLAPGPCDEFVTIDVHPGLDEMIETPRGHLLTPSQATVPISLIRRIDVEAVRGPEAEWVFEMPDDVGSVHRIA